MPIEMIELNEDSKHNKETAVATEKIVYSSKLSSTLG